MLGLVVKALRRVGRSRGQTGLIVPQSVYVPFSLCVCAMNSVVLKFQLCLRMYYVLMYGPHCVLHSFYPLVFPNEDFKVLLLTYKFLNDHMLKASSY